MKLYFVIEQFNVKCKRKISQKDNYYDLSIVHFSLYFVSGFFKVITFKLAKRTIF